MNDKKILFTFSTWEEYNDLMKYLEDRGVRWFNGVMPTAWGPGENMGCDVSEIIVRLAFGVLSYGDEKWYKVFLPDKYNFKKIHWKVASN